MVQSNNATYGGTGQIEQQFAITRARAMEARREVAVATTNSVSGFIDRDGRVVQRTTEFTAASMVVRMPRRSALTPAIRVAPWLDRGLAAVGLGCCVAGFVAAPPVEWVSGRRRTDRAGDRRAGQPSVCALSRRGVRPDDARRATSSAGHPDHHPDLQRGREHRPDRHPGPDRGAAGRRPGRR